MKERIVWSNDDLNIEDFKEYFEEENLTELSDTEKFNAICDLNDEYLDDERANLNKQLPTSILVIATLGLWNGIAHGYRELNSNNLKDCLSGTCGDYVKWYVDSHKNLRCTDKHHDGTNHYLYRRWKEGLGWEAKENFLDKIYRGVVTAADISRNTVSIGRDVAEVYGW